MDETPLKCTISYWETCAATGSDLVVTQDVKEKRRSKGIYCINMDGVMIFFHTTLR